MEENNSQNTTNPSLTEWLKQNPHKGLNEYYQIFGIPPHQEQTTTPLQIPRKNRSRNSLLWPLSILGILIFLFYIAYDSNTKSFNANNLKTFFSLQSKEKKAIIDQIENTYFGLVSGAYTLDGFKGKNPDELPFYNQSLRTLLFMGFTPFANLRGDFNIEAKNIQVEDISNNEALVNYNLLITKEGKVKSFPITMNLKKIGGNWKLDGQIFIPEDESLFQ